VAAVELHGLDPERMILVAPARDQLAQLERVAARSGASPACLAVMIERFEAQNGRPAAGFDLRRAARAMTAKALILHSWDDDACDPAGAGEIAAAWPGAECAMTDGLGHRLIAQDGAVVARMVEFLLG
jgi:pimeloyl-ACP methyl ester carboxylesterase